MSREGHNVATEITNGNHWVYVVVSSDGSQIIYGDPKGWRVPWNFHSCFDPVVEMLQEKSACVKHVQITRMHIPNNGTSHFCQDGCSKLFPLQTCQSLCGGIVLLVAVTAVLNYDVWEEVMYNCKCSREGNVALKTLIRNPSANGNHLYLRALFMHWLTSDHISSCGHDFTECYMSMINAPIMAVEPPLQRYDYDHEFPSLSQSANASSSTTRQAKSKFAHINYLSNTRSVR